MKTVLKFHAPVTSFLSGRPPEPGPTQYLMVAQVHKIVSVVDSFSPPGSWPMGARAAIVCNSDRPQRAVEYAIETPEELVAQLGDDTAPDAVTPRAVEPSATLPPAALLPVAVDVVAAFEQWLADRAINGSKEYSLIKSLYALRYAVDGRRKPLVIDLAEYPDLARGFRVRTAAVIEDRDFPLPRTAKPNVTGVIATWRRDKSGFFVTHDDGSPQGMYDPEELTIIGRAS